jgi:hypothetical protein
MKIRLSRAKIRVTVLEPSTKGPWNPQEALELLSRLSQCLAHAGISHWVTYGSLLGLVRQNSLLAWDNDIDIAVAPGVSLEALRAALQTENLRPQTIKETDRHLVSVRVYAGGIRADLYVLSEQHGMLVDFEGHGDLVLTMSHPRGPVIEKTFGNKIFPVPAETEAYLAHLYGPDWRIPDQNWSFRHSSANRIALDITSFRGALKYAKSWLRWQWKGCFIRRQKRA